MTTCRALVPLAAAAACSSFGCSGQQRILGPASTASAELADLFWAMLLLTGIPAVVVIAISGIAAFRRRRVTPRLPPADGDRSRDTAIVVAAGAAMPAAILVVILLLAFRTGSAVTWVAGPPALTIEVVGHQFWWEVRYPEHGIVTANEIHVPANASVLVRVSSADVIHSFWVPALGGKLDMIPGRVNEYRLEAAGAGVFRGQCAEFCGIQHARMAMLVFADSPDDFERWLAARRAGRSIPTDERQRRGEEVFAAARCNLCHAIRGRFAIEGAGSPGPDLTHLAERTTLAAVTVDNTRENLRAFIRDPHAVKVGLRMPASPGLDDAQLDALVSYLLAPQEAP